MTLDELDHKLPNGFHDAEIFSIELDYVAATAKMRLSLWVGWPDDPEPERQEYQHAILNITGLCFCSIDPPDPSYPFLPDGKGILASGDPAAANHLPSLPALRSRLPEGVWCYRLFVDDWNAFIHIAARDAEITWIGPKPKHAE
jgi:hypothetical protein